MGARRAGSYHGPANTRKAGTAPASQETTMRNPFARGPRALIACLALVLPAVTPVPAQAQTQTQTQTQTPDLRSQIPDPTSIPTLPLPLPSHRQHTA